MQVLHRNRSLLFIVCGIKTSIASPIQVIPLKTNRENLSSASLK